MDKKKLNAKDRRIDRGILSKPFDDIFEFWKMHPDMMTKNRLIKFAERCAKHAESGCYDDEKIKERLDRIFIERDLNTLDFIYDKQVVLHLIKHWYLSNKYGHEDMIKIVQRVGGITPLMLIFTINKHSKNLYYLETQIKRLRHIFNTKYVRNMLKKGFYEEVLTLAALGVFTLPAELNKQEIRKLRKHLWDVLTFRYLDKDGYDSEYVKNRVNRAKILFTQCPQLFTMEHVIATWLSSEDLAKNLYENLNVGHKTMFPQKTIGSFLDNPNTCYYIISFLVWQKVEVNRSNWVKIYAWVLNTMKRHKLYESSGWDSKNKTLHLFRQVRERYDITVSFDHFLDVIIARVMSGSITDIPEWSGYHEKKVIGMFFSDYEDRLYEFCNYEYRRKVESFKKRALIMDLFFERYLPLRSLHKDEKVEFERHALEKICSDPNQVLKLAQKHPTLVHLSEEAKFSIFKGFQSKDEDCISVTFGSNIGNTILIPFNTFERAILEEKYQGIENLYEYMQTKQIQVDWPDDVSIIKSIERCVEKGIWYANIYFLILMQEGKYIPKRNKAREMLKQFNDYRYESYFDATWNALPKSVRPKDYELCVSQSDGKDDKIELLRSLLKKGFVKLNTQLIAKMVKLYGNEQKKSHSTRITYEIESIMDLKIEHVEILRESMREYKTKRFLEK